MTHLNTKPTQTTQRERWLDGLAVLLSGTCMVHCLVLPLL
ncbi:MAG: hypothetical protein ACI9OF_000567, partial [Saprospiraceae bacterium]